MLENSKKKKIAVAIFLTLVLLVSSFLGIRVAVRAAARNGNPLGEMSTHELMQYYEESEMSAPIQLQYRSEEERKEGLEPWIPDGNLGTDVNMRWFNEYIQAEDAVQYSFGSGAYTFPTHNLPSGYDGSVFMLNIQLPGKTAKQLGTTKSGSYYLSPLSSDVFFIGLPPRLTAPSRADRPGLYMYRNGARFLLAEDHLDTYGQSFAVSSNGRYIVYRHPAQHSDDMSLYLLDTVTMQQRLLPNADFAPDKPGFPLGVSNDGTLAYFTCYYEIDGFDLQVIYVQNLEDASVTFLTQDPCNDIFNNKPSFEAEYQRFHLYLNIDGSQALCSSDQGLTLFKQGQGAKALGNYPASLIGFEHLWKRNYFSPDFSNSATYWVPVEEWADFFYVEKKDYDDISLQAHKNGSSTMLLQDLQYDEYHYNADTFCFTALTQQHELVRLQLDDPLAETQTIAENVVGFVCAYGAPDIYYFTSDTLKHYRDEPVELFHWRETQAEQLGSYSVAGLPSDWLVVSPNGHHAYIRDFINRSDYDYYYQVPDQPRVYIPTSSASWEDFVSDSGIIYARSWTEHQDVYRVVRIDKGVRTYHAE